MKELYSNADMAKEFGMTEEDFVRTLQELGVFDENGNLAEDLQGLGLQEEVIVIEDNDLER